MIGTSIYCNPLFVNHLFPESGKELYIHTGEEEDSNATHHVEKRVEDDLCSNGESESYSPNTAASSRSPSFNEVVEIADLADENDNSGDLDRCGFMTVTATPSVVRNTFDEIKEALRSCEGHPFLNIKHQQTLRDLERMSTHVAEYTRLTNETAIRGEDRSLSLKILVREAHRLHIARVRRQIQEGKRSENALTIDEINSQWHEIADQMAVACDAGSYEFLQRRLSCMCVFNSQSDLRVYSDNDGFRIGKVNRQRDVLARLQAQEEKGGNSFFLEQ
ncbi:hypothetical protein AGDE_14843 [Angomonas deanei]|uniref:Uncharacterized protein n=1 Tax=Angomonas deanei TaxID=59799 RepID=A0A7G2CVL2_9TRYP|nr:hypothetical protein AGDE_14843 [Angomonas deanei]CAD2222352.1 hypothetical protein, conserved [Angomonas deanei]|eukprot:EPY20130.1 hypothetical protein AGDE_14843 [Angomonas deanei]